MQSKILQEFPAPPTNRSGWPWSEEIQCCTLTLADGVPWPKISVVTPSYNQGQFLEATIRSVLLQGYPDVEYIIIDGCSTDQTLEIIQKYERWLSYWVSETDRGQGHAINKGIQKATGEILLWLNSDDLCLPGAFERAALAFRTHPTPALVTGQARIIDTQGQITGELRSHFTSWEELATNPRNSIRQISTFFTRRLFDELGLINESLHIAMDTELFVRFTQFHAPLILNEYLTAYRIHADTKTHHQLLKGYEESDSTRGKLLPSRRLIRQYRRRSSANWLSLSELENVTQTGRTKSLIHAIRNYPLIMFSRNFWYSVKKMATGC